MTATKPSLAERMSWDKIRMQATHCGERVEGPGEWNPGWPYDEWRCTLTIAGGVRRSITVTYRLGIGHQGKRPAKDHVMDALLSDASGLADGESYEEWCKSLGFDTDSRRAEKTYVATLKQTERLKEFLGSKFDAYMYETERL